MPWLDEHTAFTAPGRYIFFSRRLLELCPHDGAAAFIIAHEIAHHELGHLGEAARWLTCALGHGGARLVTTLYRLIERTLFSAQNEADADAHALDLCMRAGYDPQKCLVVFAILQKIALDFRATDEALGTDELQDEHMRRSQWTRRWHAVWYQLRRGYPSIQERRARLDQHLEKKLVALSGRIAGLTPTQLAWVRWGGRARNWFESCISETVLARVPYE